MRTIGENLSVQVNDITVAYSDLGPETAPPVIFIHGFPFNRKMWDLQLEALKNNYRVIAYDIRGHGNTTAGIKDFSIETFSEDFTGFMEKLNLTEVIGCGLSMGGYILLATAKKSPTLFRGLLLASTQCMPDSPEAKNKRTKAISSIQKQGIEAYADESIKKLFSSKSFTARKGEVRSIREMICTTSVDTLCKTLKALAERKETCSDLHELTIPVLVMAGEEDAIIAPDASEFLAEQFSNSFFEVISSSGHLSNLENTHEFNGKLKKYLEMIYTPKESRGVARQHLY
ncbi:MAG: alpha/beta fold hydrolase [Bacteroidia bacterium]